MDIQSPLAQIGYQGIVFTSDNPSISFNPQPAGFPSTEYGYTILPAPEARQIDRDSPFGMVHSDRDDPYLRGYLKTLTWNTLSPYWFANRINEHMNSYGLIEVPLINKVGWEVDDTREISSQEIDDFGDKLGTYLDALIQYNVNIEYIQFGLEENKGGGWPQESHTEYNLRKKMERVDYELSLRDLDIKKIFSMRGFYYPDFDNFLASQAGTHFDILGVHPYRWPDFPTPEGWLINHIKRIKNSMDNNPEGPHRILFT